jgi:DNA-binding response OmpR family regulator
MSRKKVLTVEDSRNIRRLIAYNLKRAGFDVHEAANGKEAVRVLQRVVPDLIILDIRMPEMDGFELLELMRRFPKAASIPVIMMTALSQPADVDRALALGVVDYLVKPLDPTLLMAKVHQALAAQVRLPSGLWTGKNRRQFVRGSIHDIPLDPSPGGVGLDLGEGGLAWRTKQAFEPGQVVVVDAPELFVALRLQERSLRCRVVYSVRLGLGFNRVGAALVGLTENARDGIRRYVLARESRSALG